MISFAIHTVCLFSSDSDSVTSRLKYSTTQDARRAFYRVGARALLGRSVRVTCAVAVPTVWMSSLH